MDTLRRHLLLSLRPLGPDEPRQWGVYGGEGGPREFYGTWAEWYERETGCRPPNCQPSSVCRK